MDLFRQDATPWLRYALGAGGVYLLGGVGAVTYWRSTDASPGAGELALWLIGAALFTFAICRIDRRK